MTDSDFSRNIRRQSRKGPSPMRHAIMAIIIILCAIASAYMLVGMLKNQSAQDEVTKVKIAAPAPQAPSLTDETGTLEDVTDLPDLIAPDIDNPTEELAGKNQDAAAPDEDDSGDKADEQRPRINGEPAGRKKPIPLVKAPIQGLSRQSPYGVIPAKGKTGNTAFKSYAKPFTAASGAKTAAIIVGGLGVNAQVTNRAIIDLPDYVTLSFAAHSPQLQTYINLARKNGHEVLIEIPMEAEGVLPDPITRTLKVTDNPSDNNRNLEWLLSRASGYFAVMNYNGDRFLARTDNVAPVMDNLNEAGLGFVFDNSFRAVSLPALATSAKIPFAEGYKVLDEINSEALTRANLTELGSQALAGKAPIGVGFAYPSTLKAITQWAAEAPSQGIVIVPASYLMTP